MCGGEENNNLLRKCIGSEQLMDLQQEFGLAELSGQENIQFSQESGHLAEKQGQILCVGASLNPNIKNPHREFLSSFPVKLSKPRKTSPVKGSLQTVS